ncbi:hypothetical protein D3C87_1876890 [compost metagenome]
MKGQRRIFALGGMHIPVKQDRVLFDSRLAVLIIVQIDKMRHDMHLAGIGKGKGLER